MRDSTAFRTRFYIGLSVRQEAGATVMAYLGVGGITGLISLLLQIKAIVANEMGGIMVAGGVQGLLDGLSLFAWVRAILMMLL